MTRRWRSAGPGPCRCGARCPRRTQPPSARSTPRPSTRSSPTRRPCMRDAEELHDALLQLGLFPIGLLPNVLLDEAQLQALRSSRRAGVLAGHGRGHGHGLVYAAERVPLIEALFPDVALELTALPGDGPVDGESAARQIDPRVDGSARAHHGERGGRAARPRPVRRRGGDGEARGGGAGAPRPVSLRGHWGQDTRQIREVERN